LEIRFNFTIAGFLLLIGNLIITFIGINVSSTPIIIMSSLIYSLYIFNLIELFLSLSPIKLEIITPNLIEEKKEENLIVKIANKSSIPKRKFYIILENSISEGSLLGKEEKTFLIPYHFNKRGIIIFKGVWIKFTGTLGLLYVKKYFRFYKETLVYPTFYNIHKDIALESEEGGTLSNTSSTFGDEFYSLRKYVPGDSFRIIAWKASAKKGELVSKQFEKTTKREPTFLLDNTSSEIGQIHLEEFDELLRLLHSISISYVTQGIKLKIVTLLPYNVFVPEDWNHLKIFLGKIKLEKSEINFKEKENYDLIFTINYEYWYSSGLQNRIIGVEFHKEKFEVPYFVFRKNSNPYDFLNIWSSKNG